MTAHTFAIAFGFVLLLAALVLVPLTWWRASQWVKPVPEPPALPRIRMGGKYRLTDDCAGYNPETDQRSRVEAGSVVTAIAPNRLLSYMWDGQLDDGRIVPFGDRMIEPV